MKIGILRETRSPPDRRVPLSPLQIVACQALCGHVEFILQPSETRCFSDEEYLKLKIPLQEDLSGCDILFGVKEIEVDALLPGKTCMFFSHTAKKQPQNRELLREIIAREINPLSEVRVEIPTTVHINLSTAGLEDETINSIEGILEKSPGQCTVCLHLNTLHNGKLIIHSKKYRMAPTPEAIDTLRSLVGEEGVWLGHGP